MVTFRNQARQVFLVVYAIIAGDSLCYGIRNGQFQNCPAVCIMSGRGMPLAIPALMQEANKSPVPE